MKAARCLAYGPPSDVVVRELPEPEPVQGHVVVDVGAAAVNFPDVLFVQGTYQVKIPVPFTPGSEFAGVVRSVGPDVRNVAVGDRVMGSVHSGAFAERIAVPASALSPVPEAMSLRDASAFGVAYRTAYHALVTVGGARAGDPVVVLGAAGGVGSACVDIGRLLGLRIVAAASSAERVRQAIDRGAVAGIDYSCEDLKQRAKELTDGGAALVVDPVGGNYAESALRALRPGGRFVTVGYASGRIPRIPLNLVLVKRISIHGLELRTLPEDAPAAVAEAAHVLGRLAKENLRPFVSRTYPLDDVAEALDAVAGRRSVGKVVITVQGLDEA